MIEEEIQQNTSTVTKRMGGVLPQTKTVLKKLKGVPTDKIGADQHPELTAKETTNKVEMDQTEAEDLLNLLLEEAGFLQKSNA